MLTTLMTALAMAAALYVALLLGMTLFQRGMIYHPDPSRGDPTALGVAELIPVTIGGGDGRQPLTSWHAPARGDRPTVVMFHGNAGTNADRAHKARTLLDAGFGVLMVEYRGYGGNPGAPTEADLYADAGAARRWLTERGVESARTVLYGESLGSGVAVEMAASDPPRALILECPFTAIADLAPPYIPPLLARLLITERFESLAKIGRITVPLLIVHGDQDRLTPPAMARALLAAAGSTRKEAVFLPYAAHNDLWDHGAADIILGFLNRLDPPSPFPTP